MIRAGVAACLIACTAAPPRAPIANTSPEALPIDEFSTRALAGPYRSIDDYCADAARRALDHFHADRDGDDPAAPLGCQHGATFVDGGRTRLGAASLVPFRFDDDGFGTRCALVLAIGGRVWVDEDAMPCRPDDGRSRYDRISVDELAWRDVVARPGEALGAELELSVSLAYRTAGDTPIIERQLSICGVGASGRPRCTPAIPIATSALSAFETHPAIARDGTLSFALQMVRDEGTVDEDYLAEFARSYSLRFP